MYNAIEMSPFNLLKLMQLLVVPVAPTGAVSFYGQSRLDGPAVVPADQRNGYRNSTVLLDARCSIPFALFCPGTYFLHH